MKFNKIKRILHGLRGAKLTQPDPYFKVMARRRIMEEIERRAPRSLFGFLSMPLFASPAFRVALAVFLVFVFAGSGTVLAAQRSLPGDKLYGLKTVSENVALKLSPQFIKPTIIQKIDDRRQREKINPPKSTPNPPQSMPETKPVPIPKQKPNKEAPGKQEKDKQPKQENKGDKKSPPKNHYKSKNAFLLTGSFLYPSGNLLMNASF